MAELPRYRESGLVSGDVYRLDFANLREQAQGMATISSSLDRISQFAFGEARKEEEKANKLTAIQARSALEAEVQKRMADLTVRVETGQLTDFNQIQSEVQAMSGWANSLKDLDIDQANGLLGSIRTSGKALLAKSSDLIVKNYQAGLQVGVNQQIKDSELTIQNFLEANPDPAAFVQSVGQQRGIVYSRAVQAGNANQAMDDFTKAAERATSNVLAKHFMSAEFATKPSEALEKLSTGNAGKYSAIWNTMSEEQRDKVTQRVLKQSADIYAQQEREKNLAKEAAKAKGLDIREDYFMGRISPQIAVARLKAVGDITPSEMESILRGDKAGNEELTGRFESLVDQGRMGEDAIDAYASSGAISWKQANSLKKMARGVDKDYTQAVSLINARLGVPDPLTPGFNNERKLAADARADFITRRSNAIANGEAFNPIETAELVIKRVSESDAAKQIKADTESLKKKLEAAGIEYSPDLTVDALNRIKSFDKLPERDKKRIRVLLRSVRGEQ